MSETDICKSLELYASDDSDDQDIEINFIVVNEKPKHSKPTLSSLSGFEAISAIAGAAGTSSTIWDQLYGKEGNYYVHFKNSTTEPIEVQFFRKGLIYKNKLKKLITIAPTNGGYFVFTSRNGFLGKTLIKCLVKYQTNKSVRFSAFGKDTPREKNEFDVKSDAVYLISSPQVFYVWIESQDVINDDDTELLM